MYTSNLTFKKRPRTNLLTAIPGGEFILKNHTNAEVQGM